LAYRLFLVGETSEQFIEGGFVGDVTVADKALHVNVPVLKEFDLPSFAGDVDFNHDRIIPTVSESVGDACFLQLAKER
jgi:hypothetical protein